MNSEWKEYKLGEVAEIITNKISVNSIAVENYISTENMLPDKGGITIASNKPEVGTITKYETNNILISNIRPYFKKIWFANRNGGCSNDVLCFTQKNNELDNKYLYYLLCQDDFFDYVMLGSKGCKMPRGDKSHIINFPILLPPLPTQHRIAAVLSSLDDKIDLLNRQNATLEKMAETLFRQWFVEEENNGTLEQLINIQNGYAFKSKDFRSTGNNGVIKIKNISGGVIDIETVDYVDDIVIATVPDRFRITSGDILIAMTGAEIGKLGIIPKSNKSLWLNQRVGLLSEKYEGAKYLAYLQLKSDFGQDYIENTATGSAQPNISGTGIEKCGFPIIEESRIKEYSLQIGELYDKVIYNLGQIRTLTQMRDTLLPKLMSGEVEVKE